MAVVGVRAGRRGAGPARSRRSPRARLAAVVSRSRPGAVSLEAALADPAVAAAIVCTPNLLHAATDARGARGRKARRGRVPARRLGGRSAELLADAAARGRVLHDEHIELLSPSQLALRARARELGPPRRGTVTLLG